MRNRCSGVLLAYAQSYGETSCKTSMAPVRRIRLRSLTITALLSLSAMTANAGGYTTYATPTTVEMVGDGVLIHGPFGNLMNCGTADRVFYAGTSPSVSTIVGIALAAITSGREMRFYVDQCVTVSFHGWTVNQSRKDGIYIR